MLSRRRANPLNTILLIVLLLGVIVLAFLLIERFVAPRSVIVQVYESVGDTLPGLPIQVRIGTRVLTTPSVSSIEGPKEIRGGCAARYIPAGSVITPDDVTECAGMVAVVLPVNPEENAQSLPLGMPAWYCRVPNGPGERGEWCDECTGNEVMGYTTLLDRWTLDNDIVANALSLPEGTICVGGFLGPALDNKGRPIVPCTSRSSEAGEGGGRVVIGPQGGAAYSTSQSTVASSDECSEEPPVSRVLVVQGAAMGVVSRMRFYERVTTPFLAAGNSPVIPGALFVDGVWYAITDAAPWGGGEVMPSQGELPSVPVEVPTPVVLPTPTSPPVLTPSASPTVSPTTSPISATVPATPFLPQEE